jgi:hypothetical protein
MSYMSNVVVWDIETVPDLKGFAAANGHAGKSDDDVRAELGDKFPKHIYHSIICIGSEANLIEFVKVRGNTKPHLTLLT